ncbi:MAG: stage II sporulation protein R [Ruminococcus sp.]
MKLFIKAFITATILTIFYTMIPFSAECSSVSDEVFRLHILANSDSDRDQSLKLKVRDAVLDYTKDLYQNADGVISAEKLTDINLQKIADTAKKVVEEQGYDYSVKAQIKEMYFDTRYYGNITMPSGKYKALRITIGEGEGHNWWCVMYPCVCVGASTNYNSLKENTTDTEYSIMVNGEYEYQFKIVEIFQKICSFFS